MKELYFILEFLLHDILVKKPTFACVIFLITTELCAISGFHSRCFFDTNFVNVNLLTVCFKNFLV